MITCLPHSTRYVVRAKERGVWQKEREHLLTEQKELEAEMSAYVAKHEGEINELLHEYWTMRKQAGEHSSTTSAVRRSRPLTLIATQKTTC